MVNGDIIMLSKKTCLPDFFKNSEPIQFVNLHSEWDNHNNDEYICNIKPYFKMLFVNVKQCK